MLFLGMINSGYAQTTPLNYTLRTEATLSGLNNYDSDCPNYCRVFAKFSNGSEVQIWNENFKFYFPVNSRTITNNYVFSSSNKIVSLRIETRRTWSFCLVGCWCSNDADTKGSGTISISDFNGGTYEKTIPTSSRIYGYPYEGTFTVKIYPTKVDLNATTGTTGTTGTPSMETQILPDKHRINIKMKGGYNYPVSHNNSISNSKFKWEWQTGKIQQIPDKWVPYTRMNYDPLSGDYVDPQLDPAVCVTYDPEKDNCNYCLDPESTKKNCCCNKEGGYMKYKYEFVADKDWQTITNSAGKSEISICGTDLMSASDFNKAILERKQIRVRINYLYGQSEILPLSGMKSSPTITKAEVIPNLCAGESNAKVKLTFSEPLLHNESLNISIKDKNNNDVFKNNIGSNLTRDSLDPNDNSYILKGFAAGEYTFSLLGKYPFNPNRPNDNTDNTYTDADGHKKTVTVKDPDRLYFYPASKYDVQCRGGADGKIFVYIDGGTTPSNPYHIYCSNKAGVTVQKDVTYMDPEIQHVLTGLPVGNYTVWLQDSKGCVPKDNKGDTVTITKTISQPADSVKIISASSENPTGYGLFNGTIFITAEGGTVTGGIYSYKWTKDGQDFVPAKTSAIPNGIKAENLGSGRYFVTVKDNKYQSASTGEAGNCRGCYDTLTVILTEPAPLTVTVSTDSAVRCYGEHGRLRITVSGGVQPYKYSLNGGAYINFAANDASVAKTELLNAGAHTVTVK
ncbi:MAG: SprB repeat-containing protein, partial [Prevotellaceae bacterium]|nr:SprB repeat-containing protein [Prevotellaceae bacterium]